MHTPLPTWLALSAALVHTTTAFYPYHYGDDSTTTSSSRARRVAQPLNPDSRSITLPLRRVPAPLGTRQNSYNIVNSKDPAQANSVAIDQDGGDLSYMVAVTFGDSKEEYHLLLDSAASNTWVMGQDCKTEACGTHNTFGKGDSGSLTIDTKPFSISYGTGSVSGTLASDTIHIGPLSPSLTFGLASNVSKEFSSYPMDGILGIGRGTSSAPQIMDALSSANLIGAKLYGIHLSRAKDGLADGELNLGAVNKDRFTGELNYVSYVENDTGFWEIPLDDAGVDGKSAGLAGRTAIIDTGTSYVLMPAADALAIHTLIPGFQQSGETFSVPCDTAAAISFTINKRAYTISTADWRGGKLDSGLCRSNIVGRQTFGATQWLVGDVFLKNVYSVFDFGGKRVGFGVKGAVDAQSASASSSATTGSSSAAASTGATAASATKVTSGAAAASQTSAGESAKPSTAAGSQSQTQSGVAGTTSASVVGVVVSAILCMILTLT